MKWLSRGGFDFAVTASSRFALLAVSLGMQSALAWLLGPAGRGEYAVCLLFASVLSTVFLFGQDWAVSYFVAAKRIELDRAISFSCIAMLLSSILAAGIGFLANRTSLEFFDKAPQFAFLTSLGWTACMMWFNMVVGLLRGARWFITLAVLTALRGGIALGGTILLIQCAGWGVLAPIVADITGALAVTTAALALLVREHRCGWRLPGRQQVRELLDYGKRTYPGTLGMMANLRIGTLLLAFFVAKEEIGIFAVAMGLVSQLTGFPDVLGQVVQPRVAVDREGRRELVAFSCRMMCWFVGAILAIILIFSEPIVRLAFSAEFLPVCGLLWILAPGTLLISVAKCTYPYFHGTDRPGIVSVATLANVAANVVVLIVLLPVLGLRGAAWAATIGYTARSIWLIRQFQQLSGTPLHRVFWPERGDARLFHRLLFRTGGVS